MNHLLNINLPFNHEKSTIKPGPRNLTKNRKVNSLKLKSLLFDLSMVKQFYSNNDKYISQILIDVCYNDIISKSGRIIELFKEKNKDCSDLIVGAKFSEESNGNENHIITYYIKKETLNKAIEEIEIAINFIDNELQGEATIYNFKDNIKSIDYESYKYSKSKIRDIIIDCSVIDNFKVPSINTLEIKEQMIITFYETELNISDLLNSIGIDSKHYYYRFAGKNTISVNKETYEILIDKIPYLISMVSSDISKLSLNDLDINPIQNDFYIKPPLNEPIVGVIDTLFDNTVYFKDWVEYHEELDYFEQYSVQPQHYEHGTSVSSIIVDGPNLNPWLDDGCGNFKVRHFGVCPGIISPTALVKKIEKIVSENQDIHVWNLSLGTSEEVSKNFISFDGAALDKIQEERNVIFVVSGTNDNRPNKVGTLRVGSPADSINSIVVNSVKKDGTPASYSRNGKILSFFNKPDVSYYGGDYDERITVFSSIGLEYTYGTSFAAPWISRKLCYLIDVLGFPKEVAKALLIDSAAGWKYKQQNYKYQNIIGYGIVPKKISNIINSDKSEIKFTLFGTSNSYTTSNYAIPVPKDELKSYYIARATLCYFPKCNRLHGVDYTQRELSLKFGIVNKIIKDINYNTQDDDNAFNDERTARREFRKWENTKFISSLLKDTNPKGKKLYGEGLWGISLTSKERRKVAKKDDLNFGVVVTLKNLKGKNRFEEFKHACLIRGYIVLEVNIDNRIDIYNKAQDEVVLE